MKSLVGVLLFLVVSGCLVKRSIEPGDAGSGDAGSCHCAVDGNVLTYSWECFCASGGCASAMPATTCGGTRESQVACGLRSDSILTPGGPFIQVFDANGALVGQEVGSDTGDFECPDDPSLRGYVRHVGTFPDAGCAVTTCDCVDGGLACPTPQPCNCAVDNGVMTMTLECFCATHDCSDTPALTCPGYRESSMACGLRVDTSNPPGGPNITVYEGETLVGLQRTTDLTSFVCPDNASLQAIKVRAGVLPDAGCAETACDCVDGGVACP